MNLIDAFNISKKDILTIVGAGGKTSLMYSASSLYRKDLKVLVTTTTKIYIPKKHYYDKIIMLDEIYNKVSNKDMNNLLNKNEKGIYIVGNTIQNSKIIGLDFKQIDNLLPYFDIIIIEGDGSKEKSLKGWNDIEPVIYPKTTKTIGVVDIKTIGIDINDRNIHRLDKFRSIINDDLSKKVKINHLKNMILNKNGLFKYSRGDKILFINKVENNDLTGKALELIKKIKNEDEYYIAKLVYGSIINNKYTKG